MNVYDINGTWIAANNANDAMNYFIRESEDVKEAEIKIRKVTGTELITRDIMCCDEECQECTTSKEQERHSLKELMERSTTFPSTLAKYL